VKGYCVSDRKKSITNCTGRNFYKKTIELFAATIYNVVINLIFTGGIRMEFNWIAPKDAAEMWGVSERRVQVLCANGQIEGVVRIKNGWLIPKGALKPSDGRVRNGRKPAKNKTEGGKNFGYSVEM
jgi:hypothetical protein